MSDHEWHDITKYNLVMPQKSMIKLYNIKSISHHYSIVGYFHSDIAVLLLVLLCVYV